MIDQVDDDLIQWVKNTIGDNITATLSAPTDRGAWSVCLYLLEVVNDPLRRSGIKPPYQPVLRYLVTTYDKDPRQAHGLLSTLLYAAIEGQEIKVKHEDGTEHRLEFEVDLEPVPAFLWPAFQVAPQPAFILKVLLPPKREEKLAPPVLPPEPAKAGRVPPEPEQGTGAAGEKRHLPPGPALETSGAVVPLFGLVLGPRDFPLMNARVELPALSIFATTDRKGRFTLAGVPAAPDKKTLVIRARRKEMIVNDLAQTGTPDEPVVIHFDLFKSEGGK